MADFDFAKALAAARAGDRAALGELLHGERLILRKLASQSLGDRIRSRASTADLIQDVMAHAIAGFDRFQGESQAQFRAWLLKILTNQVASLIRLHVGSQGRSLNVEQQIGIPLLFEAIESDWLVTDSTPSRNAMRNEADEGLHQSISDLSRLGMETIRLREFDNMSFQEIAMIQGCTEGAAQKRYARAIMELGQRLREN